MDDSGLTHLIDTVCGEDRLRIEFDLGDGFVRLRSSEAERRQAAQDIRSSEDVVIELLRNARDAGAHHVFVATQKTGSRRLITIVDDGCGIPASMHRRIFEPRVTSKLDTAHMDKWGMHGRGMALYSIAANALSAQVERSAPNMGASLSVELDTEALGEKTDQSTFPHFEKGVEGVFAMRGPKNILRTTAEFALEHRDDLFVYIGTPVEIVATLYAFGAATLTPAVRAFPGDIDRFPLIKQPALLADPSQLSDWCENVGLSISNRSARRVIDGQIPLVCPMTDRLKREGFPALSPQSAPARKQVGRGLKLADEDRQRIAEAVERAVAPLAERYFLEGIGSPSVTVSADTLRITVPIRKMD